MKDRRRIQWIASLTVVCVLCCGLIAFCLYHLSPENGRRLIRDAQRNSGVLLAVSAILLAGIISVVDVLFRVFVAPLEKLTEETSLIGIVNSRHRVKVDGGVMFRRLVQSINAIAVRFEAIQAYDQEKISSIRAEVEKERNILAAVMGELPEGIVVCNTDGRIILFNPQARHFLNRCSGHNPGGNPILADADAFFGLGRSIYEVVDKNQIRHAVEDVIEKLKRHEKHMASYFVAMGNSGELLRGEVLPVLDDQSVYNGFFLIIRDITQGVRINGLFEANLTAFTRELRASSASIRATIETILAYPDMDKDRLDRFREVIHSESVMLGEIVNRMGNGDDGERKTEWPLVQMSTSDLLVQVRKKAMVKLGLIIKMAVCEPHHCILADAYTSTLAILFILSQIRKTNGHGEMVCSVDRKGQFIHLDFSWDGQPVKVDRLREWDELPIDVGEEHLPFALKEVLRYHGVHVFTYSDPHQVNTSGLRVLFPACDAVTAQQARKATIIPISRPEFFDFDLFAQTETLSEGVQCPLTELSCTVFDTETTGLDPAGGDEIISIGAVRIVNGHLLVTDSFEQLVDPHRDIPMSSMCIHGLGPEVLRGKPAIDEILPRFHRFAAGTILVGHNAAFDMRMLQVKEKTSGVRFTNPVLDTLLLSTLVHPAQETHTLEAVAQRLGVDIIGRHSAMGDAVATAEIFLKMIPLLADKGIRTLQDALTASRKSYYARLKY